MKITSLFEKFVNKETISYLIFGVLTTVVNAVVFYIINDIMKINYMAATIISWVFAVLFAYITNKIWVFNSRSLKPSVIIKEMSAFISARLFSLGFTVLYMYVSVDIFGIDEFISLLISNVFVVIMNYVFSKIFIFKNK